MLENDNLVRRANWGALVDFINMRDNLEILASNRMLSIWIP